MTVDLNGGTHEQIERTQPSTTTATTTLHVVDCICDYRGELWATAEAARVSWLQHVLDAVLQDEGWVNPAMYYFVDREEM